MAHAPLPDFIRVAKVVPMFTTGCVEMPELEAVGEFSGVRALLAGGDSRTPEVWNRFAEASRKMLKSKRSYCSKVGPSRSPLEWAVNRFSWDWLADTWRLPGTTSLITLVYIYILRKEYNLYTEFQLGKENLDV